MLMKGYIRAGKPELAVAAINERRAEGVGVEKPEKLQEIIAYAKMDRVREVEQLMAALEKQNSRQKRLHLPTDVLEAVFELYLSFSRIDATEATVKKLLHGTPRFGFIIDTYAKYDMFEHCERMFDLMCEAKAQDVRATNAIMRVRIRQSKFEEVVDAWESLVRADKTPNGMTWSLLLQSCLLSGDLANCIEHVRQCQFHCSEQEPEHDVVTAWDCVHQLLCAVEGSALLQLPELNVVQGVVVMQADMFPKAPLFVELLKLVDQQPELWQATIELMEWLRVSVDANLVLDGQEQPANSSPVLGFDPDNLPVGSNLEEILELEQWLAETLKLMAIPRTHKILADLLGD
eukprot:TRINITY_DN20944_c0_g1_i1.p1 TRINITY_DN20944_c0_g1~~TRINITY_DN20944_c0_g1_i1.p1  ORF type:complete len:347 (-),score=15.56 TRINITY_DN20944_c0_g1_i1:170-1210(-)